MNNEDPISRAELLESIGQCPEMDGEQRAAQILECILAAPTIDPVHQAGGCYCKECRRWKPDGSFGMDLDGVKRPYGACEITHCFHKDDHFCGYGRLREAQDG